jgi:hypothetical protein
MSQPSGLRGSGVELNGVDLVESDETGVELSPTVTTPNQKFPPLPQDPQY